MATAPFPSSHAARYWRATLTLFRSPASVTLPPGTRTSRSAAPSRGHLEALPLELMGAIAEEPRERLARDRHEVGVGHPRAVEAVLGLADLVLPHPRQGDLVDLRDRGGSG